MKPNLKVQAKSILARGLKFQLGHLIIDLWNWQFEGTGVAWHLQDWVDFVGGSQPLVSLLPVARDSGEQRACLVLDAPLVDEELLHAAVDRVHEEIGHPHSASQSIVLGSIYVCVCVSLIVGNLHNRNQGNL